MKEYQHLSHFYQQHSSTITGKLNYLNFISERLIHHYNYHCNETPPMLSVSEFLNSLNKNQLVIKIAIQTDEFTDIEYPTGSHLHFDDDYVVLTNCKVSPKNYLFIFEGVTKTKQEIKLFWGEHHFDILKHTLPCSETVTEFETLKQQITQSVLI